MEKTFFDFTVTDSKGNFFDLKQLEGKVSLVVNVASFCGFTPQYKGLEELYQKYKTQGFTVLGFPCNQFGAQESKSDDEIQSFCSLEYGVSFPVLKKIEVNGENADPLYKWLKSEASGILGTEAIKWNFTKFLIDRAGKAHARYAPTTTPASLIKDIEALLQK